MPIGMISGVQAINRLGRLLNFKEKNMPFDFSLIPESKADVIFEYKGQTLNAVIDVNKITQEVANMDDYALALISFVDSWDSANPLTLEFLRKLPIGFLANFFRACQSAAFPKVMTAER